MKIYVTFDRYEHNEWASLYHLDTNKQRAIAHWKNEDVIHFLNYGPDDCHSLQLVKVDVPKEKYFILKDFKNCKDILFDIYNGVYDVEEIFSANDDTNFDILDYYCKKFGISEDEKYEVQEKLFEDDDLYFEIIKEYIAYHY